MKRFHIHVSVDNLAEGIRFYSTMFATAPAFAKPDYAKWMLDDPRINFAISQRGRSAGVDHLGVQVDSGEELAAMKCQLEAADSQLLEQKDASCCYAKSDKYWIMDPAGVPWETFHSIGEVAVFGDDAQGRMEARDMSSGCCAPKAAGGRQTGAQTCCSREVA